MPVVSHLIFYQQKNTVVHINNQVRSSIEDNEMKLIYQ